MSPPTPPTPGQAVSCFETDAEGKPRRVAGCPPDYFAADGQLWGNPLYDWDYHRRTGYAWWILRIRHALSIYDILRIDHFRGFDTYWAIPAGETTARNGRWEQGPRMELFCALHNALGSLPIVAEDLGEMFDSVRELLAESGFPGMKVLQFAFTGEDSVDLPHNYPRNCVAYPGTHDNNTLTGWFAEELTAAQRKQVVGDGAETECPTLEHIVCFETGGLDEIKAYGSGVSDEALDARIDSVQKTDLCSIVYTSGSTAAPKGVEMTHEHYCATAFNLPDYMPELLHDKKNTVLLFLPQAHSFARAINYICVASNLHISYRAGHQDIDRRFAGGQADHHDRCSACAGEGVQRCFPEGRSWRQGRCFRRSRGRRAELYEGSQHQGEDRNAYQGTSRGVRSGGLCLAA